MYNATNSNFNEPLELSTTVQLRNDSTALDTNSWGLNSYNASSLDYSPSYTA